MTRSHIRRRAFATLTALGLVVVVAIALTALTALVAQDVKRSLRQSQDAQVRQLLVAGEVAARASLREGIPGQTDVALPVDLSRAGYSLRFESLPSDAPAAADVHIRVTGYRPDGRSESQSLRYVRAGDVWELRTAELP